MRLAGGTIFGWAQLVVSGDTFVQFYIRPKFLMVLVFILLVEATSTVTPTLASTQQPTSASTPTSKDAPTTFWAWGFNGYGQLGDETTANRKLPVQESRGATNWASVTAGEHHTVALRSDGSLWAWGANWKGQLGDGTTTGKDIPIQESTGATNWSDIAAGFGHTVALKSDGRLWAWGANWNGQLGDGTNTDKKIPTQESTGATNWSAIAAGSRHTVGLKSDGTLWAWGANWNGQLGDGTKTPRNLHTQESTGAIDWSVIAAGGAHTVALK